MCPKNETNIQPASGPNELNHLKIYYTLGQNVDSTRFILLARETSANYIISQIKTRATSLSGLSRAYGRAAEVSSF